MDTTFMDLSEINWDKPVLYFEETRALLRHSVSSHKKWGQRHRKICQPVVGGQHLTQRDAFIAWLASGPDGDVDEG